jgi:hypothetical protein
MLKIKQLTVIAFLVVFMMLTSAILILKAQDSTISVQCGTLLEAEITQANPEQNYTLQLSPGDAVDIHMNILGAGSDLELGLYGPNEDRLASSTSSSDNERISNYVVPSTGEYVIKVYGFSNDIGAYTIGIGCTFRDGTQIAIGEALVENTSVIPAATPEKATPDAPSAGDALGGQDSSPQFSGVGFPGLVPVDFAQGATIPLTFGSPSVGSISEGFVGIFGFTFTGSAGDVINLSFERQSGNLNLGLAVLSEQNEIAFQASLVTSSLLSTRFTLPSTGEYTIGVFRIELLPPDAPEATTFQITGAINP